MFQRKLRPIYHLIQKGFTIQVDGADKIDPDRNYIFAMNHLSVMDIPITYAVLAPRTNRQINLFLSHIFYNLFFPLTLPLEAISINMKKGGSERTMLFNRSQLEKGVEKLRQGNSVLIYPEGGMDGARTSEIARGETGAVRLAVRTGVPILPIGITGTNHAYPFTVSTANPLKLRGEIPVQITIGDAVYYQKYRHLNLENYSPKNHHLLRNLTEELMALLARLSGLGQIAAP
jgi:1-acyl-sn-glycerol-3-phosphate acyltransferase